MLSKPRSSRVGYTFDAALIPKALWQCLNRPDSLTRQLQAAAQKSFSVRVFQETWVLQSGRFYWQREVGLYVDDVLWIQAVTSIPLKTLSGAGRRLLYLKNRPLGALLFKTHQKMPRTFTFSKALFSGKKLLKITRHSTCWYQGKPLFLSESFQTAALEVITLNKNLKDSK